MASLNITISSEPAVANAKLISNAVFGIARSAQRANEALAILERSTLNSVNQLTAFNAASQIAFKSISTGLSKFNSDLTAQTSFLSSNVKLVNSNISKMAYATDKSSELIVSKLGAVKSAANGSLGELAFMSQKASKELGKMPRTFISVERAASGSIGTITKFFGQLAIGVFLVGELVMIFTALAGAVSAFMKSMSSTDASEITYQFAVLKNQLIDIAKNVFEEFSGSIVDSLEAINKWIAQNKQDIVQFFVDSINGIKNFFRTAKEVYSFIDQHAALKDLGIVGIMVLGATGGSALAKLGLVATAFSVIGDVIKGIKMISDDKISVEEFIKGMLEIDMSKFSNLMELREFEFKNASGASLSLNEQIRYKEAMKKAYEDEISSLEKLRELQKKPLSRESMQPVEVKLETVNRLKELRGLVQGLADDLKILRESKDTIEPGMLGIFSPEFMKAQKDIFDITKIATPDYMAKLKRDNQKRYEEIYGNEFFPGLLSGGSAGNYGSEQAFKIAQQIAEWDAEHSKTMFVYSESYKKVGYMAEEFYNLQIERENLVHSKVMESMLSQSEKTAELARHKETLYQLEIKYLGDVLMLEAQRQEMMDKPTKMEQMFGSSAGRSGQPALDELTGMETGGWMPASIRLSIEAENKLNEMRRKRLETTTGMTNANLTLANSQHELTAALEIYLAQVQLDLDTEQERNEAYDHYAQLTGKVLPEAYKKQVEEIDTTIRAYKTLGLSLNVLDEIRERLMRLANIKLLEGQDDLVSGFYAGLLRLKDEIEPWGKIMSDAVVNAAHDMYNAMDDFFFNALEGRMDSFLEYFEGAMSGIRKMMAGYLTENVKKGLGGILPSAAQMVGGQIQQGGGQTGFSMGGFSNVPQTGFWSKPIFSGAKSRGGVGDDPMAQPRMTLGQGAGALLMGGATAYSIYQQSQGMSPGKAATSGALTGAMGGAAIGAMFGGVGAIVGAVAGAVMGGVSGYLMGEQQDKAKLEVATGAGVDKAYGSTRTPFGLFGFETAENVTNAGQYKGTFEKVKEATESLAEMMTDAQVSAIREYFEAGWDSSRIKGDMDPKEIEGLFKEYFAEIGEVWGTSFGAWMQDFDGTLDELFESIKSHVEAVVFIQDTLNPKNLTEYDSEVNTFNENVDRMRYNLEETGGTIEELNQIEQARIKGLQDLKQVYIDSFESLKMQMAGMSDQNVSLVMWAKQFNTTAPDVISNWESIEAVIMSWDFDTFNDKAKASGMTLAEFTDMILAFDNAAASTAAMLYDINIQSAQAAGVISDFDATIMGINKQFDDWIFQTKDLAGATEYATILEERRTKAIEKATQALEASYYSALAGLPGLSTGKNKQFATSAIASKYGLSGSDITSGTVKNLYNSAVSGGFSYDQVRQYMDSFGWKDISVSEFVSDIGTLHDIYFPKLEDAASGASDALDKMRSEMESLLKSIQNTIIGIDELIWELTGGKYAPVQSMEGFKNQYAKLFGGIAGSDDPYAAFGDFKSFIPGMVDFMGAFGGYKDWNASVIEDLMGLKDTLKEREEAINIQLQVTVQVERRAISRTVTDAIVVNEGGITNVLAEKIGDILNLRLTRRT